MCRLPGRVARISSKCLAGLFDLTLHFTRSLNFLAGADTPLTNNRMQTTTHYTAENAADNTRLVSTREVNFTSLGEIGDGVLTKFLPVLLGSFRTHCHACASSTTSSAALRQDGRQTTSGCFFNSALGGLRCRAPGQLLHHCAADIARRDDVGEHTQGSTAESAASAVGGFGDIAADLHCLTNGTHCACGNTAFLDQRLNRGDLADGSTRNQTNRHCSGGFGAQLRHEVLVVPKVGRDFPGRHIGVLHHVGEASGLGLDDVALGRLQLLFGPIQRRVDRASGLVVFKSGSDRRSKVGDVVGTAHGALQDAYTNVRSGFAPGALGARRFFLGRRTCIQTRPVDRINIHPCFVSGV